MAVSFDPAADIPVRLRQRIERWNDSPPKLQFSQYGPLDKYFNLRFPKALVKPQGLLRPKDHRADVAYYDILGQLDAGEDTSVDSTGQAVEVEKNYPDFVIASYYEQNAQGGWPSDLVRLVCEIGSLYDQPAPTASQKSAIQFQLSQYMYLLGREGERWDERAIGVAIIGTEVSFSKPRRETDENGTVHVKWTKGAWLSLYGKQWDAEMKRIAAIIDKD
ncbi:hypothetical protein EWM64_g8569 [Hericium alpestre]|uniref:Fungal-type protein kinase domain-containing protein n=1 Tax=Hericium alpestre TaxID=135208 RepID=A0A4Y9ZMF4_9AGAM|nr:hypothetical protein EWM64_g8569 [Hericium alpestre]